MACNVIMLLLSLPVCPVGSSEIRERPLKNQDSWQAGRLLGACLLSGLIHLFRHSHPRALSSRHKFLRSCAVPENRHFRAAVQLCLRHLRTGWWRLSWECSPRRRTGDGIRGLVPVLDASTSERREPPSGPPDTAAPVTPVTLESPGTPLTPEVLVAPVTPVSPSTPLVPVTPVAPASFSSSSNLSIPCSSSHSSSSSNSRSSSSSSISSNSSSSTNCSSYSSSSSSSSSSNSSISSSSTKLLELLSAVVSVYSPHVLPDLQICPLEV
ncbi:putative protein TPRXL [Takifugu rubripes]|uniref:putative protein TPRXL n=1 Tax=Takifugu rubripes TaxID=31033 RepID=UPI001145BE59|nr:putative protein TPRXL [Takifugu rubripes]